MKRALTKSTRITELRVWTISNGLSVSRIVLLPFIYHFLHVGGSRGNGIALILMLIGVFTDILDGLVARRTGVVSSFGKILDPLADKICIGTMIIILVALRGFPLWLVGTVVVRDLLIVVSAMILIGRTRVVLSSNWLGKATTFFLALLIFAYTLEWQRLYGLVTAGAVVFLVASTGSYGVAMHRQLQAPGEIGEATASVAQSGAGHLDGS